MEHNREYTYKMIEAFVQKPKKVLWYQNAFSKFNINGIDNLRWHWSWWAFFGSFLFLLYRKQYTPALILLLSSVILGMVPFIGFIIAILAGGYSSYFVYKGYKTKLNEIELNIDDEDKRIETMGYVGGFHQWVVWISVTFYSLIIVALIAGIIIPRVANRGNNVTIELACFQMNSMNQSLKMFKLDNGVYPTTNEGLEALISNPNTTKYPKYFLDKII